MVGFEFTVEMILLGLLVYYVIGLIAFIPALVSIIRSGKGVKYKLVWIFLCLILGAIGILIYFIIERKKKSARRR